MRKTPIIYNCLRAGLLCAAALLLAQACGPKNTAPQELETPAEEPAPVLGFHTEDFSADTLAVKSGETFSKLMTRLGMSVQDSYTLSQMCTDSIFDLKKLRAGNHFHAYYEVPDSNSARILRYAVYEQNKVRSTVFRCSDSLAIWNVDKPVEMQRRTADVLISSSLWNDMRAAGASPALIVNLADIYQWSVNFFALQPGDRFRIIYTQSLCEGEVIGIDTVHFSIFTPEEGREVAALRFETEELGPNTYWDKGGESLKRMFLKAPLKYNRISSRFSYHRKHPVTGVVKAHTAVDYAAPTGTPVYAIGDGTVTLCGWDGTGGGNRIRIKHPASYESCYMHLSKFAPGIRVGSRVSQGQLIGYVGRTGTATGPHLDFRMWEKGRPIDPLKLDSPASEPLDAKYREAFDALYLKYIAELNGNQADSTLSLSPAGEVRDSASVGTGPESGR